MGDKGDEAGRLAQPLFFYVDASLLGLAQALAILRKDVTYPGAEGCPVESPDMNDEDWLPIVAEYDWVVLMKDDHLRYRELEKQQLLASGLRTFCLTRAGNYSMWRIMKTLLLPFWDDMEGVARSIPGPYIYSITQQGVRPLFGPGGQASGS